MKKRNRLLAIVLTAIMTLSMVPSAVFATEAAGSGETAEAAVEEVSSVGEEQDAEPAAEEVTSAEETAKETVQAAEEDDEAEAEEAVTEEAADPAMDQENEAAEEEAAGPEETEESVEPAAAAEEEVAAEEAAETVEWPVTLESKGSDYTVTASFDESAGFPADAKMKVSEIKKSSGAYQDYYDQALEAVQNETDRDIELTYARFFDITFYTEKGEVEPTGPVNVTIKYNKAIEAESRDDVHVLHFDDNDKAAPEIMDIETGGRGDKVNEVSFETDGFSVYAVIGTGEGGDDARLTVNFNQCNSDGTTTLIKTMYVKNADSETDVETIIYDPGAGTVASGYSFYGWSIDDLKDSNGNYYNDTNAYVGQDYTAETTPMTIAQVKTYIKGLAEENTIKEGDVLDIYAMTFTHYTVEYLDSTGKVSVGSGSALVKKLGDEASYKINVGYPTDDTHNFEGWLVKEGLNNITDPDDATNETLFDLNTEIKIKGNITFMASAPEGHWLVFDENGKGATYNAPRFFENNEPTSAAGLLRMERSGYTFGGWYKEAACENEFDFGDTLSEKTIIYAKWTAKENADYTILIWKQNLNADGYDFAQAITLEGPVGQNVNTVTQNGTGDSAYATINGTAYQYEGFHLDHFDQNVVIVPEGTSVVNVYYNRTEYTLQFQIYDYVYTVSTGDNDNNPAKFGDVNGEKALIYWRNGAFRTTNSNSGPVYEGTVYTRSQSRSWQTVKEIKALYQQSISDNFPIVGDNGTSYANSRWMPQNSSTFSQVMVYIDIMPAENVTFHQDTADHEIKTIYYYTEALEGETADRTYNGKDFVLYKSLECNYNWFTEAEDYIELSGFNKGGTTYPPEAYGTKNADGTFSNSQNTVWHNSSALHVLCYYTRQTYSINFMDGVYVDGDNNPTDASSRGQLHQVDNITYGADISSYNKEGTDYYEPTYSGYMLEGWFIDSACTQAYTFETMPEDGITVYAKWRLIQYRVFLHPKAYLDEAETEKDPTLNWGSASQEMNFRVSYGKEVSTPEGRRTGYEFYGWYFDNGLSVAYPDSFKLHEDDPTYGQYFVTYDKTLDFTDVMDPWGEGATWNSDITGWDHDNDPDTPKIDRYWVTKKLDLYARWSQVTVGADGINVVYNANGGSGAPSDDLIYKDNSTATAGAASTPAADQKKVFKHWVVQTWNGNDYEDTDSTVLPGGSYTIHVANSKVENKATGEVVPLAQVTEGNSYKYTIQLRAEYADIEDTTPTHIVWYMNDGSEGDGAIYYRSEELDINQATLVPAAPTRTGYEFLGWAKDVETPVDDEGNPQIVDGERVINLTTDKTVSDFLDYDNGTYYKHGTDSEVTKVAADEMLPYEGLYAIWKRDQFHIYHSGTGEVQDVDMPEEGTTIDLTEYVADKTKYLYGGYYHTDLNNLTKGEPYTEPGTRLVPVADTVYYLKEVPNTYLKPQIYLIYNPTHNNLIQGLYGFVNVDSNEDYSKCGVVIDGTDYEHEDELVSDSILVTKKGQEEPYATLNATNLFGMASSDCYIGKSTLTSLINGGVTLQISGYYVTKDNIKVTGYKDRLITFPEGDEEIYGGKPLFTSWGSGKGQTYARLRTVGTTAKEIQQSSPNPNTMMAVRTLKLAAPSDKIEYTITKIYDSGTEEQTVEGGNYTGQITYVPKDGYMFAGWYQDADFTAPADFSNVTGDMTVYAKYISNKDVTIAFSRKSKKSDTTTFNATISVKNRDQLDNVTVNVNDDISAVLADKSVKKSGSGKNVKYTTQYKGQVAVKGLSMVDSFTASASWITPDGTPVTGTNRKCTYLLGNVTVR